MRFLLPFLPFLGLLDSDPHSGSGSNEMKKNAKTAALPGPCEMMILYLDLFLWLDVALVTAPAKLAVAA
jgi:hypothetical protein